MTNTVFIVINAHIPINANHPYLKINLGPCTLYDHYKTTEISAHPPVILAGILITAQGNY